MQQFLQKFIEEVTELMDDLEKDLLALEKNPTDNYLMENIMRGMHTLKGSGSMFGFNNIVELVHKVENVYEKVKKNEIQFDKNIVNLTFSVTDLILKLLQDVKLEDKKLVKQYNKAIEALSEYFSNEELQTKKVKISDNKVKLYYITFEPDTDIESRGVKIKNIFLQLDKIGQLKIVPKSNTLKSKYPISWEIYLATEVGYEVIEDILLFIDLECEITHLSNVNLLTQDKFIDFINENVGNATLFTVEELKKAIQIIIPQKGVIINKGTEIKEIVNQKKSTLRVDADRLDDLMKHLSELITLKSEIKLTIKINSIKVLKNLSEKLEKVTSQIKNEIFEIRLVRLDSIRVNIERLIRDTSSALKKEIDFTYEGLNTELDKTIVEKLSVPIMHIVRNSIDHGIEAPEIRAKRYKPKFGNIQIKAFRSGSFVYIEVSDDGDGINKDLLIEKAIAKNIIKSGTELSKKDTLDLIFAPGLSTSVIVSEVSGRGVGMDVVKSEIIQMRGNIYIDTVRKQGTKITFKLPLSISIVDTLLVKSGDMYFSVPLEEIDHCMLIRQNEINYSENEFLNINSELIPYVYLRNIFNITEELPTDERAIILKNDNKKSAIIVDKIIGDFQAEIKPFADSFEERPYLSGGSLMPDGNIAYILETRKLIEYYKD